MGSLGCPTSRPIIKLVWELSNDAPKNDNCQVCSVLKLKKQVGQVQYKWIFFLRLLNQKGHLWLIHMQLKLGFELIIWLAPGSLNQFLQRSKQASYTETLVWRFGLISRTLFCQGNGPKVFNIQKQIAELHQGEQSITDYFTQLKILGLNYRILVHFLFALVESVLVTSTKGWGIFKLRNQ